MGKYAFDRDPSERSRAKYLSEPGDNYFKFVNDEWLQSVQIPASKVRFGAITELETSTRQRLIGLLNEPQRHIAPRLREALSSCRELYQSMLDPDPAAVLRTRALHLEALRAVTSFEKFVELMGEFEASGCLGFAWIEVSADDMDPTVHSVKVSQAGISLPSAAYYENDGNEAVVEQFRCHVERALRAVGQPNPEEASAEVVTLERSLAASHLDPASMRDTRVRCDVTSLDEIKTLSPEFPWETYFRALGLTISSDTPLFLFNTAYAKELSRQALATPLSAWKSWAIYHWVRSFAPYMTDTVATENFDFYSRHLFGVTDRAGSAERALNFVSGAAGEHLGSLYVGLVGSDEWEQARDVVDRIRRSVRAMIADSAIDAKSKEGLLRKLDCLTVKIGAPNEVHRPLPAFSADDPLANALTAARSESLEAAQKVARPVDRNEWFLPCYTVNAYYNSSFNEIVVPAGILQPPFFSSRATLEMNLGGLGVIVGHELAHSFDNQGILFDWSGRRKQWATDSFLALQEERRLKLIRTLEGSLSETPHHLKPNTELVVDELRADIIGLRAAISALPSDEVATDARRSDFAKHVLEQWARSIRAVYREKDVERIIRVDPHLPAELRCNAAVQHIDAWYKVYAISSHHRLWLSEGDRLAI